MTRCAALSAWITIPHATLQGNIFLPNVHAEPRAVARGSSALLNEFATLKRFAFIGVEGDWRRLCMLPGLALAGDLVSMTVL
jgi:hypothetical protein